MTESQQVRGRNGGRAAAAERQGRDQAERPGRDQAERPGRDQAEHPEQVAAQHHAHGQSVASWTCVSIIMLGALIMAVAVVVTTVWLFVVGAVVVVLGVISGKVLAAMGFGVSGRPGH
jgi:Flp pilus assembly protein TadB